MTSPRVLIVVPTLGRRLGYLAQTLASIAAQHDEPADVVVVAPDEATQARAIAVEAGATVVDEGEPRGMAAAINAGWRAGGGQHDYIGWLGDDDLLTPGSLRTATAALDGDPRAVVAFGHCEYIDDDGRKIWLSRAGRWAPWILVWGPDLVPQPGSLFRRTAVEQVGGLDESFRLALDHDLFLRLRKVGRLVNTGKVLSQFRWHGDSLVVSNRTPTLDESDRAKRRSYTPLQRRLAFLWEKPVRGATRIAVRRLNRRIGLHRAGS